MTTFQLANALAKHTRYPDIMTMPASAMVEVLLAINGALQIVYSRMPAAHKMTTVSHTLRAPETVAVAFAARYTNTATTEAFTAAQVGCTALVGDDPDYNEITATDTILDEYLGATLDTTAIVYGDVIPIYDVIERITSPVLLFRDGRKVCELERWQQHFDRLTSGPGHPERYTMIPLGSSQGANPEFYVRVWPLPDVDYKVRFEAELATVRVTFPQVSQTPVNLPLNDRLCESVLLPIARGELTDSVVWSDPSTKARMQSKAAEARESIGLVPMDVAPGFNQVGTPAGY